MNKDQTTTSLQPHLNGHSLDMDELETLRRTSLAITQILDREALLEVIVQEAAHLLGAKGAGIFEDDPDRQQLIRIAATGPSSELVRSTLKYGEGAAGVLIHSDEPFSIAEDRRTAGGRRILEVPLCWRDRRVGILYVDDDLQRTYSAKDARLLGMMADHAAIALENARNLAEIRRTIDSRVEESEREARDRELLRRISMDLSTKTDINQVLSTLLEGGSELLKVEMVVAHLITELPGQYRSFYRPARLKKLFTPPRPQTGLTTRIMQSAEPIIIHDTRSDQSVNNNVIRVGVRSIVAFPLIVRGVVTGVLFFNSRRPQFFGQRELDLISLLVRHGAVAIENARAFARLEKNANLSEALVQVGQELALHSNLDGQMATVRTFVAEHLHASALLVGIRDTLNRQVDVQVYEPSGLKEIHTRPVGAGLLGHVLQGGKPLHWKTRQEGQVFAAELNLTPLPGAQDVESALCFPLTADGGVFGVLAVQSDLPHAWGDIERAAFQTLARLVSVSFRNSQLIAEIRQGNERLETAYAASKEITARLDPDQALHDIVARVCQVMDAWQATVILIDQAGYPQYLANAGFEENIERITSIRPEGISMQVVRSGQPRYIENVSQFDQPVHPKMVERGVQASACIPLVYLGACLGVLWIHYLQPRSFSEIDKKAIQLYASQAAIAYVNARRVRGLEHMRQAAGALSSKTDLDAVLNQIVVSARKVLGADSAALWSYDPPRDRFILKDSVASGIPSPVWEKFRLEEPRLGQTTYTVMHAEKGWMAVEDLDDTGRYPFLKATTRQLLGEARAQSFQGLRLSVGNEVLGILYVNYNHKRSFLEEEERRTAITYAHHAALALKNARLVEQMGHVRKTGSVVAELTVIGQLEQTLNSIVEGTLEVQRCDVVTLYTYDEVRDRFDFPPCIAGVRDVESVLKLGYVDRDAAPYRVIALDDLHFSEDSVHDPVLGGPFTVREGVQATVGIPLVVAGHKVGVMFGNYRKPHRFTHDELENFHSFANQAAIAIYNAHLYEQLQQRARTLGALNEAGRAVTGSLKLDEILGAMAEQAWRLTGQVGKPALFSTIMLVEGETARFAAVYPPEERGVIEECMGAEIALSPGAGGKCSIVGRAIRTGESQLVGDVSEQPDYLASHVQTRSELVVPLKFGDKVIGVINVEHAQPGIFDRQDQRDLELLAAQASIAIEHARNYETLKKIKGFVGNKTAHDWIRMVSQAWGHSIKRDTATGLAKTALIRRYLTNSRLEQAENELDLLDETIRTIQGTPITAPLSIEDAMDNVEINLLLQTYLTRKWKTQPYNLVDLCFSLQPDLDNLAAVRASREWLRRGVEILVDNAVQAMQAHPGDRRLVVETCLDQSNIHLFFRDTGPGIPEEIRRQIGREPVPSRKGAGVGLVLAAAIMETYGGKLWLESTGPGGAVFAIQLPAVRKTSEA